MRLEVCVDSPAGLAAAVAGGADRVELCAALALGGLTPAAGLVAQAAACGVPVVAMIRPRPGDFVWSEGDLQAMEADIAAMRAAGLSGGVLGASKPDGRLDDVALARLCAAAAGMERVLHRAFDLVPDPGEAVEIAVARGFDRILTSGGAVRALDGLDRLAQVVRLAAGRIGILPGSGLTPDNVATLLAVVPVAEVHASCAGEVATGAQAVAMGFAPARRRETDAGQVRAMKAALAAVQSRG